MQTQSKALTWTGWVITVLISLMMSMGIIFSILLKSPDSVKQFTEKFGYPEDVMSILAMVQFGCGLLYLIPRTAVLGAVLLTGYLGGAVATHVRVHDNFNFIFPVVFGVLVWFALFLRDSRIRELLPFRK